MTSKEWIELIRRAIKRFDTPFYLFSQQPVKTRLNSIRRTCGPSVANYLSLKTLPLRNLLRWWLSTGLGVEVVSEFELLAAREEGYPAERIIVNGVGKHSWNKRSWVDRLRVNFDSIYEIKCLAPIAKRKRWRVGIRFHPNVQNDPEHPQFPDQFGLSADTFVYAVTLLREMGLLPDTVHMHLRSNVPNIDYFTEALKELRLCSHKIGDISLKCLDLGGGLPAKEEKQLDNAWQSRLSLKDMASVLRGCRDMFPSVQELILENGRFILSPSGVLVLTVIDVKEIHGIRQLICDGGRTNHALPSDWEDHKIDSLPRRIGKRVLTGVYGPTCMAYDCLTRKQLPNDIRVGDKMIWFDAGAYHLSWETRFSKPLAQVLWHDETDRIIKARAPERFREWWGRWR